MYLIAFGVYRFLTKYMRPEPVSLGGLTFYQWASPVLVAAMVGQWWVQQRQEQTDNHGQEEVSARSMAVRRACPFPRG
jgi:prolipoprotein diacylglyceryltransferase